MFLCSTKDLTTESQEIYIDIDEASSRAPAGQDSDEEDTDLEDVAGGEAPAVMALPVGPSTPGIYASMSRQEEIQNQIQNLKEEMATIPDQEVEVIEIHDTIPPSPGSKRVADLQARIAYLKNLHNQEAIAHSPNEAAEFPRLYLFFNCSPFCLCFLVPLGHLN